MMVLCHSRVRRNRSGFSLVELLAVVSIVALVVGLATVGIGRGLEAGDKAKAKSEVTAIVAAVKAYYQEYGTWPITPSQRDPNADEYSSWVGPSGNKTASGSAPPPSENCKRVMRVLSGENVIWDGVPMNPKQVKFLEGPRSDGTFLDPWGYAYSVKMDTNDSGAMEYYDPGYQENVRMRVIAISYGKDGIQNDPDKIQTKTCDDVLSWR